MITGNFAMLAGVNPLEVHQWYLSVYADALEWVEAPNVIGMSQFADGGYLQQSRMRPAGITLTKCQITALTVGSTLGSRQVTEPAPSTPFIGTSSTAIRKSSRETLA